MLRGVFKLLTTDKGYRFSFIDDEKFELCCINPGLILGPLLHGSTCTSMEVQILLFVCKYVVC